MELIFLRILNLSLQMSFVIVALYIWKCIGGKRYYVIGRYVLWLIICIRLLIPVNLGIFFVPTMPNAIATWLKEKPVSSLNNSILKNQINEDGRNKEIEDSKLEQSSDFLLEKQVLEDKKLIKNDDKQVESGNILQQGKFWFDYSIKKILSFIWIIGIIIYFIFESGSYMAFQKRLKRWRIPVTKKESQIFYSVAKELTISKKVQIYYCNQISSPMMTGIIRPCVYLPNKTYDNNMLYFIFRHELIHIKHYDICYKLVMLLVKVIYWFNPLIYLMCQTAVWDMEEYCDFDVIKKQDITFRKNYSIVMLQNLIGQDKNRKISLTTCFYGGKNQMKNRFKNIMTNNKKKYGGVLLGIFIFLIFLTGNFAFNKEAESKDNNGDKKTTWNEDVKSDAINKPTNILLLGIDNMVNASPIEEGRADTIILATVKQNQIIFTNIQRELYVKEGDTVTKFNSLYQEDNGIKLKGVLEQKLDLKIDSMIKVDFIGLEKIIDTIGGIKVNLTQEEADYLNQKNFITKKKNRTVLSGNQLLNGNQAVGYSRIRVIVNEDGLSNGFGRGQRNLSILTSILKQCKNASIDNLISLVTDCVKYVTTDMSPEDIVTIIKNIDLSSINIVTQQIPEKESAYEPKKINDMLVMDYEYNTSNSLEQIKEK